MAKEQEDKIVITGNLRITIEQIGDEIKEQEAQKGRVHVPHRAVQMFKGVPVLQKKFPYLVSEEDVPTRPLEPDYIYDLADTLDKGGISPEDVAKAIVEDQGSEYLKARNSAKRLMKEIAKQISEYWPKEEKQTS